MQRKGSEIGVPKCEKRKKEGWRVECHLNSHDSSQIIICYYFRDSEYQGELRIQSNNSLLAQLTYILMSKYIYLFTKT